MDIWRIGIAALTVGLIGCNCGQGMSESDGGTLDGGGGGGSSGGQGGEGGQSGGATAGGSGGGIAGGSAGGRANDGGVPPGVSVVELPMQTTGTDGLTPEYSVDVTALEGSFQITAVNARSEVQLQVQQLKNPNGVVLADGDSHFMHKSRSVAANGAQAALVPESPDFESLFVPGRYTFRVKASTATSVFMPPVPAAQVPVSVSVAKKNVVAPSTALVVDVNLHFTGAAGVDAAAARTNARVQGALTQLADRYSQAGIALGEVRYFDTPAGYDAVKGLSPAPSTAPKKSVAEVLKLSAGAPTGINFFFVEELDPLGLGIFTGVLGISGGIPGPTLTNGTDRSGVVVVLDVATWVPRTVLGMQINDDFLGTLMAHEAGHFVGLSHSFEQNAGQSDNLTDTPTQMEPMANDNLMQPAVVGNGGKLSPLQVKTMRRNPLVREGGGQ